MTETTVTCSTHRIRVIPGTDGTLVHTGGNVIRHCSSQRFTVTRRVPADRDEALAVLTARPEEETSHGR